MRLLLQRRPPTLLLTRFMSSSSSMATSEATSEALDLGANLRRVSSQLDSVYDSAPSETRAPRRPRLLAVSKTKPADMVIKVYQEGHRDFGENYIQELVEKSNDPAVLEQCPDIRWHFIGTCQSNKAKMVARVPHLHMVETVTSVKLANLLQRAREAEAGGEPNLAVFVQVNTSGEAQKGGVDEGQLIDLVRHIKDNCPNLEFRGLMTIGALGHSVAPVHEKGANPDFLKLIECRRRVAQEVFGGKVEPEDLELSMGMSSDFEEAIRLGSTSIRVGTSIFGARNYPPKASEPAPEAKLKDLSIQDKKD